MATREEIGRRVRQAREEQGLSQSDFGRSLSRRRTHVAISDLELGKVKVDAEELSEIAFKLQKDISYFYTGATTSLPVKLSGSIIYRRGDNSLSDLERQQTDLAIEGFKKFARKALTSVNPEHD